jgi:hypothetical protein
VDIWIGYRSKQPLYPSAKLVLLLEYETLQATHTQMWYSWPPWPRLAAVRRRRGIDERAMRVPVQRLWCLVPTPAFGTPSDALGATVSGRMAHAAFTSRRLSSWKLSLIP